MIRGSPSDRRSSHQEARTPRHPVSDSALLAHDLARGVRLIAGVDEVGRACLAGPISTEANWRHLVTVSARKIRSPWVLVLCAR